MMDQTKPLAQIIAEHPTTWREARRMVAELGTGARILCSDAIVEDDPANVEEWERTLDAVEALLDMPELADVVDTLARDGRPKARP